MHKLLLLFFSFILFNFSWAKDIYRVVCSANRGQLGIEFKIDETTASFSYFNVKGGSQFPLYEGVVTKDSIPVINIALSDLKEINQKLVVEWKSEQCTFKNKNDFLFKCDGEGKVYGSQNTDLKSFILRSALSNETSFDYSYDVFKIRLGLDSANLHHSIVMPFNPKSCFVTTN
jgi:hypothetical protein